jgi:hypothetical protein
MGWLQYAAELLLQDLQQVSFGQIHAEDGVKFIVPWIALPADGHRQGHEVFRCRVTEFSQPASFQTGQEGLGESRLLRYKSLL